MVELIKRDIPFICTVSAKDLNAADRFMLEKIHKVSVDNWLFIRMCGIENRLKAA